MYFLKNVIYLVTGTIVSLSVQAQIVNFDLTQFAINDVVRTINTAEASATFTALDSFGSEAQGMDEFAPSFAVINGIELVRRDRTDNDVFTISFTKDVKLVGYNVYGANPGNYLSSYQGSTANLIFTIAGNSYNTGDAVGIVGYNNFAPDLSNVIISAGTVVSVQSIVPATTIAASWTNLRVEVVPEPSAYALILGGGVLLLLRKRRSRRSKRA